jgi:phage/plasmid-associated DNA primase
LVSADTQILTFDDVRKRFDFERLFSIVTEGITLEKKNKDAIKIPFHKSPKIVITTNYAIKGSGNSFARRKWELEFKKYYSKDFTPYHEFGRMLFDDWDEDEWCRFDNYMIECLQLYLSNGLIESESVNLKERKFHAETCKEFADWCADEKGGKIVFGKPLHANELYEYFTTDYPDFAARSKYTISRRLFTQWLRAFNLYETGTEPVMSRDRSGQLITFTKEDTPLPKQKKEDDGWSLQEEIPF